MLTIMTPEYIKLAAMRTLRIKEAIAFGRDAGLGDDQIKKVIIKRYDLTPTYAQNFLDDASDPDDSRPEAI